MPWDGGGSSCSKSWPWPWRKDERAKEEYEFQRKRLDTPGVVLSQRSAARHGAAARHSERSAAQHSNNGVDAVVGREGRQDGSRSANGRETLTASQEKRPVVTGSGRART